MKQYAVRITRQARAHLRGIKKYIEEELLEPDVARSTIDSLKRGNKESFTYACANKTYR